MPSRLVIRRLSRPTPEVSMTTSQFCVFEPDRSFIHDFYVSKESASIDAARLTMQTGKPYQAGELYAWTAANNLRARDGFKLARITEAFYNEMLNCLPPMYRSGSIGFFLSERETGSITAQFVISGGHYYGGYVDLLDRSTWITAEKIDDLDRDAEPLSWFPVRDLVS
jgi:hypothetical protein